MLPHMNLSHFRRTSEQNMPFNGSILCSISRKQIAPAPSPPTPPHTHYIHIKHVLTRYLPRGPNLTVRTGPVWPESTAVCCIVCVSASLMQKSEEAAASAVWDRLTSMWLTAALNRRSKPRPSPWKDKIIVLSTRNRNSTTAFEEHNHLKH